VKAFLKRAAFDKAFQFYYDLKRMSGAQPHAAGFIERLDDPVHSRQVPLIAGKWQFDSHALLYRPMNAPGKGLERFQILGSYSGIDQLDVKVSLNGD